MPTDPKMRQGATDLAGTVTAVIFILLACLALWDTTSMTDSDSFVFPRAVAAAMIVFCILLIVFNLLGRTETPSPDESGSTGDSGSTPRRIGLVAAMIGPSLIMPWAGFLLSGLCAFAAIMLFSMYDPWTGRRKLIFPLAGFAVVIGFYTLFSKVLLVPLPTGTWFN